MSKKWKRFLSIVGILLIILIIGLSLGVRAAPQMGYCFEAAFDPGRNRLYMTAGNKGLHIFNVAADDSMTFVSTYYDEGYYRNIEIAGDYAYIANSYLGLKILDISAESPKTIWTQAGTKAYGIEIRDDIAFTVANDEGMYIFDVSNPSDPHLLSHFGDLDYAWDLWIQGDYAYIADFPVGLVVLDISDLSKPVRVAELTWHEGETVSEVIAGEGDFAYVAAGSQGLYVIDISTPSKPKVSFHVDPGFLGRSEGVIVQGDRLYVSTHNEINYFNNGLYIYDIEHPGQPELLSKVSVTDMVENVTLSGSYLALANSYSGIVLLDINDTDHPKIINTYPSTFWRIFTLITGL